jgi:hypothetical protein
MWRSQPINGQVYVMMPSLRDHRMLWWLVPGDQAQPPARVAASEVPEPVRRRGYRAMWNRRDR